ncbi:uncharacterized protein LOC124457001 [Xenia sp. Carnegie-2017]|uniref:uncharacterized protein LOC124457001 n=1 Tax=Xenia sp. Carnegie-2017 TaxID=2897299 RepID=UPI001F04FCDF|nr:uncharacterized protein LOC124457001 [Xenia sp. Carnegie-2017]
MLVIYPYHVLAHRFVSMCIFGPCRPTNRDSEEGINGHPTGQKRRFRVQPTKKLGCKAQITVRELTVYPDYIVPTSCNNKHQMERVIKPSLLNKLKSIKNTMKQIKK